ncbi:hypothetical protein BOX15_Mlig006646g1 [Macrostomum lignano]|uniref:non-specific serine/threonine protein kinase n=1 Tax=Macrostomum lignano TaxID=282301 RepID=A0A267EYB3_9PLAT|nr:hypothetical protein BOX15_Mlig006646g1 [Macrostomum lignano]
MLPYHYQSDVWALGCCVYEMATLKHAFNARDFSSLSYKILKGRTPDMPTQYSSELLELMRSMLNLSPEKRPSVNRILRDPFIRRSIQLFLESTRRPGTAPNSASRQPLPPSPSSAQQLQRQQHQQEHVRRPPRPPTSAAPAPQPSMPPFSSPSSRRNSSSSCTSAPSTPAPAPKLPKSSSVASELQAEAVPESAAAAAASAAAATPSAVKAVVEASPRVNTAARRRRREHLGLNSPAFTNSEQYSNLQSLVLKQKQRRPKTANPRLSPRDSPKASVPAAAAVGNDAGRDSSEHEADASEKRQKRQKKSQSPVSDKTADRNGSSGGGGGGGGGSRSNSGDREQQQAAEMADLVEHMNQTLTVAAAAAAASPRSGAAASDLASASNPTEVDNEADDSECGPIESKEETLGRTGRMRDRMVQLRRDCLQQLGLQLLRRCYEVLDDASRDPDDVEDALRDIMGPERFQRLAGKVWQLKYVEERLFPPALE